MGGGIHVYCASMRQNVDESGHEGVSVGPLNGIMALTCILGNQRCKIEVSNS